MSVKLEGNSIVVACSLNEEDEKLLDYAQFWSRKLNCKTKLVHVVEPWFGSYVGMPMGFIPTSWASPDEVVAAQKEGVEKKLQAYASKWDDSSVVETCIHVGDVSSWVIAESNQAALIIVGMGEFEDGYFKNYTTAFKLLSRSQVPVFTVPKGASLKENTIKRVLFADDLEDHSMKASRLSFNLAMLLGGVEVIHAHATSLTLETLNSAIEMAKAAAHLNAAGAPDPNDLYKAAIASIEKHMSARCEFNQSEFQALRNSYNPQIVEGNPIESVRSLVGKFEPDLQVFGRHQAVHMKPFSFGAVPFQAMVDNKTPLMVVPT